MSYIIQIIQIKNLSALKYLDHELWGSAICLICERFTEKYDATLSDLAKAELGGNFKEAVLAWVDPVADPTGGLEQVGHDRRTYRSLSLTHTHNHPSTDSFATSSDGVGGGIGGGVGVLYVDVGGSGGGGCGDC